MPDISPARTVDEMAEAFVSTTAISREVSRRLKAGRLRKLASRLYTTNLLDRPESIIRRNLWNIVAGYFPGALIADRTALENAPAEDGSVCLVTARGSMISLPGITLRPRRGVAPLATDRPFLNGLFLSSTVRAYLDNLRPSRTRGGLLPRTVSRQQLEERLDALMRLAGGEAANELRDQAHALAPALGATAQAEKLNALIGAVAGTRGSKLISPAARARQSGKPYDPARMALFETLHTALRGKPSVVRPAERSAEQTTTLAFYDAYFSNFIEGTEFAVGEAAGIIFQGRIPDERPADAHDILGIWRIVSDAAEMRRLPEDAAEFLTILQHRHAVGLKGRPEVNPGEFKRAPNQSGGTLFVLPADVVGTLERGFTLCQSLETAFQRAAFVLFLVTEVHPFADGNGRIARIMMNAELAICGEERIIIPTVFRGSYLAAQRALSHNQATEPLIRMLDYAQRWTAAVSWRSVEAAAREIEACNAFLDSEVGEEEGRRLLMPGSR